LALKLLCNITKIEYAEKAKLRVIGGRLPALNGGGPTASKIEQSGKATDPKETKNWFL
jgi:hypothetical protein